MFQGRSWPSALSKFGYERTRQAGSHIRLTRHSAEDDHHITIPDHTPLKVGTLSAVLRDVASNLSIKKTDLIEKLFG